MREHTFEALASLKAAATAGAAALAQSPAPAQAPAPFLWTVGFEGSCLPHLQIDEYEWTQHDVRWREDFRLVAGDLGCRYARYPLAWHLLEPQPGRFNWRWLDERLELANSLGLCLLPNLAHFGTPLWLPQAFGDEKFPAALERFARAFGKRYASATALMPLVCPFNEPSTTAFWGGDSGLWPPHGRSLCQYTALLSRIAQGTVRAIAALRETMPQARILVTDPLECAFTDDQSDAIPPPLSEPLRHDVARRLLRRFLSLDLITGRVDETHGLWPWLQEHGFSPAEATWLQRNAATFDVLGLDYYRHTESELCTSPQGRFVQRVPEYPCGLFRAARQYWQRYNCPLMIAETSATGNDEDRGWWLEYTVFETRRLREQGIPVMGYTWWPVIDHLDWDGALLHRTGHIHPVGIYRLERGPRGELLRRSTGLRDAYRELIERGDQAVGACVGEAWTAPDTLTLCPPSDGPLILPKPRPDNARPKKENIKTQNENMNIQNDGVSSILKTKGAQGGSGKLAQNGAPARPGLNSPGFNSPGLEYPILDYPIIVHSHLRWDWVWQRPQQFLSRLSMQHRVLFIEGPHLMEGDFAPRYALHTAPNFPNVTIMHTEFPAARFGNGAWVDAERRRLLQAALAGPLKGQFDQPVQWFYDPMAVTAHVGYFQEIATVYDCMDELSQFKFAPPEIIKRERELLARADVVFTGGRKMWESKRRHNANCHFYGCGVDIEHFGKACDPQTVIPPDLDFIPRPILGYFGVVDERLDYDLIARLAEANPHWSLALVGPVFKVDPNHLPRPCNVYWLGARPYDQLPAYTKGFDACLMPFALNEATEYINPTKALEYMAAHKPIISTAVADVVTNFGQVVKIGRDGDEFIHLCREAVNEAVTPYDEAAIARGVQMAQENTWEAIVAKMEGHIREALAHAEKQRALRPAEATVEPRAPRHSVPLGQIAVAQPL